MKGRYFNTSGPNIIEQHYTLMREGLVKKGLELVHGLRYFTIWAPRQTGKSTYFLLLKKRLEKEGYKVIHMNVEGCIDLPLNSFLTKIELEFEGVGISHPPFQSIGELSIYLGKSNAFKLVLIIDEIEGLNPLLFNQFLHSLRNLYHFRDKHCLKSVVLVGVSNMVGVVEDNASPFNIADNVNVPYFSTEETLELLGQHEKETGQMFAPGVKEKISEMTGNQPGLVNGFGYQLQERCKGKPVIEYEDYLKVEDWYIRKAIDKNVSNIINKAKKYRPFVEELLFKQDDVEFNIDKENIKFLYVNGVIDEDENGNVYFNVPLYRKRLHNAFSPDFNGEQSRIFRELWISEYYREDGTLNYEKIIADYKGYVQRRGFKPFREKGENGKYLSIKEAALVYSFETYIQAFLIEAEGKSYLEPHAGLGTTDLLINARGREDIVEFKVFYRPGRFVKGKGQLAYYCKKIGLDVGYYLVFVPNTVRLSENIKEGVENIEGVTIKTFLVFYDEEKDF